MTWRPDNALAGADEACVAEALRHMPLATEAADKYGATLVFRALGYDLPLED